MGLLMRGSGSSGGPAFPANVIIGPIGDILTLRAFAHEQETEVPADGSQHSPLDEFAYTGVEKLIFNPIIATELAILIGECVAVEGEHPALVVTIEDLSLAEPASFTCLAH